MTPHFVLVVGCQRSGTTLIGQMIGAHPDAVLVDEDEGAYRVVAAIADRGPVLPAVEDVLPLARKKYLDRRAAESGLPPYVVLKAPNATYLIDELRHSGLPASYVFAARDVREVVRSMLALPEISIVANQRRRMAAIPSIAARFAAEIGVLDDPNVADHVKATVIWRAKTGMYRDFCESPTSALLVRYPDLVEDPARWQARTFEHIGMPSPGFVDGYHRVMHGRAIGNTDRQRPVDRASQGRWHGTFSTPQLSEMRDVAAGLMEELSFAW